MGSNISEDLFFMGEDTEVVTIASGRPEFPKNAPAIATVISHKQIQDRGIITLSEMLSQFPGFYSEKREWGHSLFLRGIPGGILFLYDGVPLTSDSTKNIYPLDEELALPAIKRVEIVRGPASVLWGPDAFVGVLNIVPKRGGDVNGIETGILTALPDEHKSFYLNLGKNFGKWEGFLSLNGYYKEPHETHSSFLSSQGGRETINTQEFYDVVFNARFFNFLHVSGRFSDFNKPYIMHGPHDKFKWKAKKNTPFKLIKLVAKKNFEHTSVSFKSYFNYFHQKQEEMDIRFKQNNYIYYTQLMLNRDLFNEHGLLTVGTSLRINKIKDAVIEKRGFLPDYLENQDTYFKPLPPERKSFTTRLKSIFCQYRHHISELELWGGMRLDDHSEYNNSFTYNVGVGWYPKKNLYFKAIYGTAYRTPYASQFLHRHNLDPEEIKSLNFEVHYGILPSFSFTLTPFYNIIHHHISEGPSGDYSEPTSQKILGLETEITYKPFSFLKLWANTTFLNAWGDKERYVTLDYFTITPEGISTPHYSTWKRDYDSGAHHLANLGIEYQLNKHIFGFFRMHYIGSRKFTYFKSPPKTFSRHILFDLSLKIKNIIPKLDATISFKNLLDKEYKSPGMFSGIDGNLFETYFGLEYRF